MGKDSDKNHVETDDLSIPRKGFIFFPSEIENKLRMPSAEHTWEETVREGKQAKMRDGVTRS